MRSRRTLSVDLDLAEEIRAIAKSKGMGLVSYFGYLAPNAFRERG